MKKKKPFKDPCYLGDFPLTVMSGAAAGFFLIGCLYSTIFTLDDSSAGDIVWSWRYVFHGLVCIGMGAVITAIGFIYRKIVVEKYGVMMPRMSGFWLIPAVLSFVSAILISAAMLNLN